MPQVDAPEKLETAIPEPLDEEGAQRRVALEDAFEEILLHIWSLEEEWRLDNRIAYSLRQKD